MKLEGNGKDRKVLVSTLERGTGEKKVYLGPPTFSYTVGPYTVLRDGSIEVDDDKADEDLLQQIIGEGLVKDPREEGTDGTIGRDLTEHDGHTLLNLINMIHARQVLINQSINRPGAFHIEDSARKALAEKAPETVEDFIAAVEEIGAEKFKGLSFTENHITFTGFPETEDQEKRQAFYDLSFYMLNAALHAKHLSAKPVETDNPRYSQRVFLIRLGMNGDNFKNTRRVLLKHLAGNAAFRTPAQAEAFKEARKAEREKEKEKEENSFHLL